MGLVREDEVDEPPPPPLLDDVLDGLVAPVTPPAGDPAVLLGLASLIQLVSVPFTTKGPAEPPLPIPRLSPAKIVTLVPARTFTFQLYGCAFGRMRNVCPPGMMK